MTNLDKEIQFIKGVGPSRATLLNKLGIFNLKDLMNTHSAKELAISRELYMKEYIKQFLDEWDGIKGSVK